MVVMILERVPPSLRGELTRWMLEVKAGVFVGKLSAMVRDRLWTEARVRMKGGAALMIYSADNEQGFMVYPWGDTNRLVSDYDGLLLMRSPQRD